MSGLQRRVVLFLLLLAVPQVSAMFEQFRRGFRPFVKEPVRVPFSWDMFSVRIERCDVRFDPPLSIGAVSLGSLRDLGAPFEWDRIYDRVSDYKAVALSACKVATGPTRARLRCYVPEGREIRDDWDCK